jgi:DNA polymerase I
VQERILEIILKEKATTKAVEYVHRIIKDIRERKVPYRDLVIWKTLTRPIEEYAVRAAHVEAAKLLQREGWEISTGDKIGYVITMGEGKLYQRAKPYVLADYKEVDVEYYVQKQIIPVASRILQMFNVKKEELLPPKTGEKKRLTDFFGS